MVDRFYGVNTGGSEPEDVTQDTSTTSEEIELRVEYDGTNVDRNTVLNAITAIYNEIAMSDWPPA